MLAPTTFLPSHRLTPENRSRSSSKKNASPPMRSTSARSARPPSSASPRTRPSSRTSRPVPRSSVCGTCSCPRTTSRRVLASRISSTDSWRSTWERAAPPARLPTVLPPTQATWRCSPSTERPSRRSAGSSPCWRARSAAASS